MIDVDDVLATNWTHPDDQRRQHQHRSRKCAEVLVPHRIPPDLIQGAYVPHRPAGQKLRAHAPRLPIKIVPDMFFL